MAVIREVLRKIRRKLASEGYTCDACGAEVFSYPTPRLCEECRTSIVRNDGYTCEKCGRPMRASGVCSTCKEVAPAFEKVAAPLAYHEYTALLVNRFKNGKRYLSYYFAEEMAKALPRLPQRAFVLLPVPMTKQKQALRGYNQAEELAVHLSELTGLAVHYTLLEKKKDGEQKRLSGKERIAGVAGAFRLTERKFCKGKDFLIIDDVMTSGATLAEISAMLLRAGARSVCGLCVAAVPQKDFISEPREF
ncbi:MAG: ComF family protein [Clostridia bacterium]|nr:ComF family protein [Clostridia bacterium]